MRFVILFSMVLMTLLFSSTAYAWYSEDGNNYGRRTIITINASINGWIDFAENITYNTNMTTTFKDIRYIGPGGELFPYCIYKNMTDEWAYIFVNVSGTVENQNISIYRYYNYTNATSQENCLDAMGYLQDMYHNNTWTNGTGLLSMNSSNYITVGEAAGFSYSPIKANFNNTRFEYMVKNKGTTNNDWMFYFAKDSGYAAGVNGYYQEADGQNTNNFDFYRTDVGTPLIDNSWTQDSAWHNITIFKNSSGYVNYWDNGVWYGAALEEVYDRFNYITLVEGRTQSLIAGNISIYKMGDRDNYYSTSSDSGYTIGDFGSCGSSPTVLTFQTLDEMNVSLPVTGIMNGYIEATPSGGGTKEIYNFSTSSQNYSLCREIGSIYASGMIQYSATGYSTRYYNFYNLPANTASPFGVNLYLLNNGNSTLVTMTVKDQSSNIQPGIIVNVQRYYPEINAYRTVAAPKTDGNGITNTYLTPYTVQYQFALQKEGSILNTISASTITSSDLTLQLSPSVINYIPYFWNRISVSVSSPDSLGNVSVYYNDNSGYLRNMTFRVTKISALGNSEICTRFNDTTPSGYFKCNIGNISGGVFAYTLVGGMNDVVGNIYYDFGSGMFGDGTYSSRLFGDCNSIGNLGACREGLFITFILVLVCVLIGLFSPVAAIILMLVGLVVTTMTGLYALSMPTLIGLILMGLIFVWRIRQ